MNHDHLTSSFRQKKLSQAKEHWEKAVELSKVIKEQNWHEELSTVLFSVAELGELDFIRQLIIDSELKEQLFPLARY